LAIKKPAAGILSRGMDIIWIPQVKLEKKQDGSTVVTYLNISS